jgi:hypothetical protein
LKSNGWPSLGLSKDEVVSTVVKDSFVVDKGCWWGVSAKDNEKELEISFRTLHPESDILFTSSPTTVREYSAAGLHKLLEWWSTAKRHAAQHFWGSGESSIPLLLVIGGIRAERFLRCSRSPAQGSETARIRVNGSVDQKTGKLFLTTDSDWHLEVNELDIRVFKSDRQQTCRIGAVASRMFRLPEDGYHDS